MLMKQHKQLLGKHVKLLEDDIQMKNGDCVTCDLETQMKILKESLFWVKKITNFQQVQYHFLHGLHHTSYEIIGNCRYFNNEDAGDTIYFFSMQG